MYFANGNIEIYVSDESGITEKILNPGDGYSMNWVLDNADWGMIDGFELQKVEKTARGVTVTLKRDNLQLSIEKEISERGYFETYRLTNTGAVDYFLTKEKFGIKFPFNCNYSENKDILNNALVNHIWCGGDVCYMYAAKLHGKPPYLVIHMIEGAADDYSISYDVSRTWVGSFYRGAMVLHPVEKVILPGESCEYKFFYSFCNEKPQDAPLAYSNAMRFTADKYSVFACEEVNILLEMPAGYENVRIYCDEFVINCEKSRNTVVGKCVFEKIGEKKIFAEVDGRCTWIYIDVLRPLNDIIMKRRDFIVNKQQYHRDGSAIDGAYLIYDDETKRMYCDSYGWLDHNSASERIGMGIFVCKTLQIKYDEKVMKSLEKHRKFVERELFNKETGEVFMEVCGNSPRVRTFNYPWMSTYYLEWYNLTGERECIINAAKILIHLFELTKESPGQCMEVPSVCEALKKEGLTELEQKLKSEFLSYVDGCNEVTGDGTECMWCSEVPSCWLAYQSQAYVLTGDEKYLKMAEESCKALDAMCGMQPDFRLNYVPVRYWDRFWFGKYPSYGDVFPHYWSALGGWAMTLYDKATGTNAHEREIRANLLGNLCICREDGFASNNYLYPYKITFYTSDKNYENPCLKPGITYGKQYDKWANDQDWALYYAMLLPDK